MRSTNWIRSTGLALAALLMACTPSTAPRDGGTDGAQGEVSPHGVTCVAGNGRIRQGETYSDGCNNCVCQSSGSLVCTEIACLDGGAEGGADAGQTCRRNADCPAGEECNITAGCDTPSRCGPALGRPCDASLADYCTCDGRTVQGSGSCPPESYRHRGACTDGGSSDAGAGDAGQTCRRNADCPAGEECNITAGCDTPSRCGPALGRPCDASLADYCTCDGRTVQGSGSCPPESYRHRGACTDGGSSDAGAGDAGQTCRRNADCPAGEECNITAGCDTPSRCGPALGRPCDASLADYCTCDGRTVQGSGSCPPESYRHRGACTDGGSSDAGVTDGGNAGRCTSAVECALGQLCCERTRTCYDSSCLGCCM